MKERPIVFSANMIKAILAGAKTQTRRIINGAPKNAGHVEYSVPEKCGSGCTHTGHDGYALFFEGPTVYSRGLASVKCRHGIAGDQLWVRERWRTHERPADGVDGIMYAADQSFRRIEDTAKAADAWVEAHDNDRFCGRWRSPLFLPRWASRIQLEITGVRVERLNAITEVDAIAEGMAHAPPFPSDDEGDCWTSRRDINRARFEYLWCELHGWKPNAWVLNPWVWVLDFKRVEREEG